MQFLRFISLFMGVATLCWAGERDEVAFRLRNNFLIVVPGSIGTMQNLNFLVDTGATQTVVDRKIMEKVGVELGHSVVSVVGEKRLTPVAEVNNLVFGPVSVPKLSVLVMDLAPVSKMAGIRIDSIVGLDILRSRSFVIDYRHKRLHFGSTDNFRHSASIDPDSPYLMVTALVDGIPVRLMLDSGADRLSLFRHRVPSSLQGRRLLEASRRTASGSIRAAFFFRDANLQLGKVRLPDSFVFVLQGESDFAFDGHLGPSVLGAERVCFDSEHSQLRWDN